MRGKSFHPKIHKHVLGPSWKQELEGGSNYCFPSKHGGLSMMSPVLPPGLEKAQGVSLTSGLSLPGALEWEVVSVLESDTLFGIRYLGCLALDKLQGHPKPQFPHPKMGITEPSRGSLRRLITTRNLYRPAACSRRE